MYRIREVDASDEDVQEVLTEMHRATFFGSAPLPDFDVGHWWVASRQETPVAFAGLVPAPLMRGCGYFCRVGVIGPHCGHGLQRRLMRVMEYRARRNGWHCIVSDTTDNLISANNFIGAGYRLFKPISPWGWINTLYWRKALRPSLPADR